jgi:hypothetical protein
MASFGTKWRCVGKRKASDDFVGHNHDRARDRGYHCLLLLGPHPGYWATATVDFSRPKCQQGLGAADRGEHRQAAGVVASLERKAHRVLRRWAISC